MKKLLFLGERLVLMQVLPPEGNYATLRLIRDLKQRLGPKDEEFKALDIKQEGDKLTWNVDKDKGVEIEFGEKETDIIATSLKKLSDGDKLAERHLTLYEKFVGVGS